MKQTQNEQQTIRTVTDLVRAFGGTAALAEFLDVGMSCVSNWKRDNAIPTGWHLRLYLEAERRGLKVSQELFGIDVAKRPFEQPRGLRRKGLRQSAAA